MKIRSRRKRKMLYFKNIKRSWRETRRVKDFLDNKKYSKNKK